VDSAQIAFPQISDFVRKYQQLELARKIKIAIIDNGIMAAAEGVSTAEHDDDRKSGSDKNTRSNITNRVVGGESFVYEENGRKSSWYLAADPHGTQMASLIGAIDPQCEIYIAKVGERLTGIDPERVTKVSLLVLSCP
jgi:hypothetical protein